MAKPTSIFNRLQVAFQALKHEVMVLPDDGFSRFQKFIHFWVLVGRSFVRNRCPVRASALSYSTLLALIPMLAVAISVTSGLLKKEGEDEIYQFIDKLVSNVVPPAQLETNTPAAHPVARSEIAAQGTDFESTNSPSTSASASQDNTRVTAAQREAARRIHDFVQSTRSGTLGITGMVLLVFVAIAMLSRIEETFNDIWGVTRGRNWVLRIVLYWTTITLGPMLIVGALGLAGGTHHESTRHFFNRMPFIGGITFKLLPVTVLWLAFTLLYQLVPNTKVRFSAALVGGMVAGTLWHVNNMFGFLYVSRVVTNSKIYGSLGLIPVFMAGTYLSWLILLFGAQIAYAFQNRSLYLQDKIAENVNQRGREFVALRLMTCIGQRFQHGLPPATVEEMSAELGVPSRLAQQILHTLTSAHLVTEISSDESGYTPARPLDAINAHHVLQAMRTTHGQELITRDEPIRAEVYGEYARIQEAERQAAASVSMLSLVNRTQGLLQAGSAPAQGTEWTIKPALLPSQTKPRPPGDDNTGRIPS